MAENKKFSVRTDGTGQNVFVSDVFLLSVPEEERVKALSINDDGRVVLTSVSGSGGGGVTSIIAGTNITISPIGGTGAVTINASGGGGGDVTEVTSATTNQITVANSTGPNPAISAVTAAISNGGTGLATADQIHTFVTTQTDEIDSDTSGNAATATLAADATTLATPRAINGVNFDGSAAITVPAAGSTLTDTVTVAKGGTNATSFADKSVIITQDSGTDTLSAVAMSTNGQLLIGGTSGPAVAVPTGGDGLSVTVGNGTLEYDLDASLTTVTSLLNTSLVVGRDATDQIKFSTDNQIIFRVNGADGVTFKELGEIEATKFDGDLEGNADTATSSSYAATASLLIGSVATADTASKITIDPVTSTDTTAYPVLVGSNTVGAQTTFIDNVNLSYNASTNALTASTFVGNLVGTALTASYANILNPNGFGKQVGATITADKNTTNIDKGYFYSMDSSGGPITFTLNAGGASLIGGEEWEFFVLDLSNDITFAAAPGESIISENGLKANAVGSGIVAKFIGEIGGTNTWALVGSLKT